MTQNLANKLKGDYKITSWDGKVKVYDNGHIEGAGDCYSYQVSSTSSLNRQKVTSVPTGVNNSKVSSKFITLGATVPDDGMLSEFKDAKLGKRLGNESSEKDVYELVDHPDLVIGISKIDGGYDAQLKRLKEEMDDLSKLKNHGLPVVEINGLTTHNGTPAIVMKKYAQGSKDIVTYSKEIGAYNKPLRIGDSPLLNEYTIKDLTQILNTMGNKQLKIDDLQFLINRDGRVFISDPLNISSGKIGKNMRDGVNLLIEAAGENIILEKIFKMNKGVKFTKEQILSQFGDILKNTPPKNVLTEWLDQKVDNILHGLEGKGIRIDNNYYIYE